MTESPTEQAPEPTVPLDTAATLWLNEYKAAKIARDSAEDRMAAAREHLERALGENTVGLVDGQVAVTFRYVNQQRLDQTKAKALLTPEDLAAVTKVVTSRRFQIVEA